MTSNTSTTKWNTPAPVYFLMFSRQFLVIFPGLFTRTIEYATFNPTVSPTSHQKKKGWPKGWKLRLVICKSAIPKTNRKNTLMFKWVLYHYIQQVNAHEKNGMNKSQTPIALFSKVLSEVDGISQHPWDCGGCESYLSTCWVDFCICHVYLCIRYPTLQYIKYVHGQIKIETNIHKFYRN